MKDDFIRRIERLEQARVPSAERREFARIRAAAWLRIVARQLDRPVPAEAEDGVPMSRVQEAFAEQERRLFKTPAAYAAHITEVMQAAAKRGPPIPRKSVRNACNSTKRCWTISEQRSDAGRRKSDVH
jgi:hypothetical protein